MDLETLLADRLAPAFAAVAGEATDPAVRRSPYADFQSGAALALARRLGRPPREIAADVVRAADLDDLCASVEVSGPGFVNLVVADGALGPLLDAMAADERLGVAAPARVETVVVDYSAPNVAKEMHIGHLRTTVLGDALARLLEWRGHRVVRANHLGDWGTPFGMLIEHLLDVAATDTASIGDLDGFYKDARAAFDADEQFRRRSRERVVALQSGDPETNRLWRLLVDHSERYFLAVYERLDVTLTAADFRGESSYNDLLAPIVDDLDAAGLLRDSDGAACVFPAGFTGRDGRPLPIIVRKSDGGFGYGATDLAALRQRTTDLGATRLLYVVGLPQRQHFEMVFAVGREAGWLAPPARAQHVGFGAILGTDGRMLRTRSGDNVKLYDVLDEAVARAADLARAKNPDLDDETVARVAAAVGIGAVKYADLSTDRVKDYVFDWDRMLSLDGNTAPYLQYAHARIRSLFRRAGSGTPVGSIAVVDPAEHALALELLAFGTVVAEVEETLEPHRLAGHLYGVATAFSRFFERCPVLRAEPDMRASRLALSDLTARVLRQGLGLLGITAPDRM
jgi:arginyl-tRNA synthetase